MFFSPDNEHYLWWITLEILVHLCVFIAITAAIVFILRTHMRKYKPVDLHIFKKLERWHSANNNRFMTALTYLGKHHFLIPANLVLIAFFLIWGQHSWYAYRIVIISLSSLLLMFVLKHLFHRRRPADPLLDPAKGKSFPSGHAIMSVNFYGVILYMILQTTIPPYTKVLAAVFLILLILAIGFSRIYLQVHYASDVLAGFIIGCCWFYTSLHVLNNLYALING
jgi:membrane-associated phospholipid phosphatase